jgi:hypothetical protein
MHTAVQHNATNTANTWLAGPKEYIALLLFIGIAIVT